MQHHAIPSGPLTVIRKHRSTPAPALPVKSCKHTTLLSILFEQIKRPQLLLRHLALQDPPPSLQPFFGHYLIVLCVSYIVVPKNAHSAWSEASTSTSKECCVRCTPEYIWPFSLQRYPADSYWTCHHSKSPDSFLQGCSPASHPPICTYNQGCPIPGTESWRYSCQILCSCWLSSQIVCQNLSAKFLHPWGWTILSMSSHSFAHDNFIRSLP